MNCHRLHSLQVPTSVKSIGNDAFLGCCGLTEIDFTSADISIGENVFGSCPDLLEIFIPEGSTIEFEKKLPGYKELFIETTYSDPLAIYDYNEPDESYCSDNGEYFLHCSRDARRKNVPDGVKEIGHEAFSDCKYLKSVSIPKSVEVIHKKAFAKCIALTKIVIPEGVSIIKYGAFGGCSNLISISLPKSLTIVEGNAFTYCNSLKEIIIPHGTREKFERLLPKHLHDRLIELKAIHDKH